jgi:hypothetical protein
MVRLLVAAGYAKDDLIIDPPGHDVKQSALTRIIESLKTGVDVSAPISSFDALDQAGRKSFRRLADGMHDAMGEAEKYVEDATSAIRDSFMSQIPIFEVYEGAIELSFSAWKKGQKNFRRDLETWQTEVRPLLQKALDPETFKLIDAKPLEAKAWLTQLGLTPDGFELTAAFQEYIDEIKLTADLTGGLADNEVSNQWTTIMDEARSIISTKYDELILDAAEAGADIAYAFSNAFAYASGVWGTVAGDAGNLFITALNKTYKVESPSKVMIDIANSVADGFEQGILARKQSFNPSVGGSINFTGSSGGGSGGGNSEIVSLLRELIASGTGDTYTFAPVNSVTRDLEAEARTFARVLRLAQAL